MTLSISELLATMPRAGRVEWIGVRPQRREPMRVVDVVEARADSGLVGDRHRGASSRRQVTLIQAEHLATVGALLGGAPLDPAVVRRNVAVSGINVHALRGARFRVGEAELEGTGDCAPCSRMEEALGPGGYNAMRGHGGITARVLVAGLIRRGDPVRFVAITSGEPR